MTGVCRGWRNAALGPCWGAWWSVDAMTINICSFYAAATLMLWLGRAAEGGTAAISRLVIRCSIPASMPIMYLFGAIAAAMPGLQHLSLECVGEFVLSDDSWLRKLGNLQTAVVWSDLYGRPECQTRQTFR